MATQKQKEKLEDRLTMIACKLIDLQNDAGKLGEKEIHDHCEMAWAKLRGV